MASGFAPIDGQNRQTRVELKDGAQASSSVNVRGVRRSPESMRTLGSNLYAPAAPVINPSRYAARPVVTAMQKPRGAGAHPKQAPTSARQTYSDEILTSPEYKSQWDRYASRPNNVNYLEKLMRLVKPDLIVEKNFIEKPLSIESILQHSKEIRIDEETGHPRLDACDKSLTSNDTLFDCLASLNKNKQYFVSSGQNSVAEQNALVQCFNDRWYFNLGEGWQVILHRNGNVAAKAKDFFGLEAKSAVTKRLIAWGAGYFEQSAQFYEVTEHRLDLICDYYRVFSMEGSAVSEKYLNLRFGVDDAQRQRELYKLFEAKDIPNIVTKANRIPDMNAERCLYSLMPQMEFYKPDKYNNAEAVELFDALLIAEGPLTHRVGVNETVEMLDPEEAWFDFEMSMSDQEREQALRRLNPQHRYMMRIGHGNRAPKYAVVFFDNAKWHFRVDLNDKTPFCDAQGQLTLQAKDFIREISGPTDLQLVKISQQRLTLMDTYLRDYRYHNPKVAMQNLLKTLPSHRQNAKIATLGPVEYYRGYPLGYRGLHLPLCTDRNFLRADSKHKWLPFGVVSADHFAPRDPFSYPGTNRYRGVPNACVDETVSFLSYMYGIPAANYEITEFHRRHPNTLDINNVVAMSERFEGLVEAFDTDSGSVTVFQQGFTETGVLAWLENLDRRLPYIFTSTNWAGNVAHTMALFFHRGSWYVYNSLDKRSKSGRTSYEPSIKKVTNPRFVDGEFVGDELTDYGRENFYDPNANWGVGQERFITYCPIDYTRLRVVRAKLNAARTVENEQAVDNEFFRTKARFVETWLDYDESQLQ